MARKAGASDDRVARSGKIGLYGFCMGDKLTLDLAQSLSDRLAAAASIHPGSLVTEAPESTPDQMAELEEQLRARHIRYQLEWHPGALHGYMMPSRSELYQKAAEEKV
jgi:carboxymethylenebutenolidase